MDGGIRREWVQKSCPRTRGVSPSKTSDQMTRPLEGGALVLAVGGPGVADKVLMPPRRYCTGPGATNWGLGAGH